MTMRLMRNVTLALVAVTGVGLGVDAAARLRQASAMRFFTEDGSDESLALQERYGPAHFSRNVEEWAIRDGLQDRRGGVFLDVGASDYKKESNTYYLETQLGWSGVAVDAQQEFAADYRRYRPRTRFFAQFVSDVQDATVPFYVPQDNSLVASSTRQFSEMEGRKITERLVRTTTLNNLLDRNGVSHVDFVSMDIELSEPKALAGFDIERFSPSLVCIEAHPQVRQEILDYFQRHRYVVVGKYLRADPKNLYFQTAKR